MHGIEEGYGEQRKGTVTFLSGVESQSNSQRKVFIQSFCLQGTITTLSSKFIYGINRKK